ALSSPGGIEAFPVLRRDRPEPDSLMQAVARLHHRGVGFDWPRLFAGTGAKKAALPTYAFQRDSYWLHQDPGAAGHGPGSTGHPLLGTAVTAAGSGEVLFTTHLPPHTHGRLTDPALPDAPVVPASALAEAVLRAAGELGAGPLERLAVHVPLLLPEHGAAQLQTAVGPPDDAGRRPFAVHGRHGDGEAPWTLHADGVLGAAEEPPAPAPAAGRGREASAEAALPEELLPDAAAYGIHPALLEAAVRTAAGAAPAGTVRVPGEWLGVRLHAAGATAVKVLSADAGADAGADAVSLRLTDPAGRPVLSVDRLAFRDVPEARFAAAAGADRSLYAPEWTALAPAPQGEAVPWAVLGTADVEGAAFEDIAGLAAALAAGAPFGAAVTALGTGPDAPAEALDLARAWLAEERVTGLPLVVLIRGGAPVTPPRPDGTGPEGRVAAAWGLLRGAQAEAPGRFVLIDVEDGRVPGELLSAVLASGEPQAALLDGAARVPRLGRAADPGGPGGAAPEPAVRFDPDGTVLITGGAGTQAALLARHLVAAHGVRHLLLLDPRAEGTWPEPGLLEELGRSGARVRALTCDTADRSALGAALAAVTPPLTGVVHTAGAEQETPLPHLTADRLAAVLRSGADTARHLHELTRDSNPAAFVLLTSTAAATGTPGLAARAAADAALDGLALHRAALGLPVTSLALGPREAEAPAPREGFRPLTEREATGLFDAALRAGPATLVALPLDPGAMRAGRGVPALFRRLVRAPAGPAAAGTGVPLAERLAALPAEQRHPAALAVVRAEVAAVLGRSDPGAIEADRAFKELGFDSMIAVELRSRLGERTGIRLPATLAFDHPSARTLAAHLVTLLAPDAGPAAQPPALAELDRLEAVLAAGPQDEGERGAIVVRLQTLLARLTETTGGEDAPAPADGIESASAEEIFALLDGRPGGPAD
ncbi:type I polyketide synthase, partial [Streptomyces sp. MP131-18]|uniref:type I polyketide synthase n=1 Tax=Streptomyces sp. MP131-18 TaxID=1857892 RepID=UPI0015C52475